MQRHAQSPSESQVIDFCSKTVFHDIGQTLAYSYAIRLVNQRPEWLSCAAGAR
jgi:hypothetical protein